VDYGPVVFPSHIGKVFHVKIVCLVLVVLDIYFPALFYSTHIGCGRGWWSVYKCEGKPHLLS
jgi:hypothetical protein